MTYQRTYPDLPRATPSSPVPHSTDFTALSSDVSDLLDWSFEFSSSVSRRFRDVEARLPETSEPELLCSLSRHLIFFYVLHFVSLTLILVLVLA